MLTKKDLELIDGVVERRVRMELKPVKDDIVKIRKDQKMIVNFFDREYLDLRKRVEQIEHHLGLGTVSL